MTEPTRKKNKTGVTTIFCSVPKIDAEHPLRFTTEHPNAPCEFDGTEFANGRGNTSGSNFPYRGAFQGRPKLINSLILPIKRNYQDKAASTVENLVKSLRTWWLMFDKYHHIAPIEDVNDFDEQTHGLFAYQENLFRSDAAPFLKVLNEARVDHGFEEVSLILHERPYRHVGLPNEVDIRSLRLELQHFVASVFQRWEKADEMAGSLQGWKFDPSQGSGASFTEAEVHAAYRQTCALLSVPYINSDDWVKICGFNDKHRNLTRPRNGYIPPPMAWYFGAAVTGMYPTKRETLGLLYLFLLKSGWNASVALAIDAFSGIRPHPTKPEYHLVEAPKARANGRIQRVAGLEKSQFSVGNLLRRLSGRVETLRSELRRELRSFEAGEATKRCFGEGTANDEYLAKRYAFLRRAVSSPWLYRNQLGEIDCLIDTTDLTHHPLRSFIDKFNERRSQTEQICADITPSDFRDAYISAQYRNSGHNWLIAQLSAGHKSARTLSTYLRKRQWKAHGERQVHAFTSALWNEVRVFRIVDAAILYRLVQNGAITEEQRQRWSAHKDRTKVGVGCRDFTRPPVDIAPHHVMGHGCRVQRCTLCSHAVVFQDSIDGLAERAAALYALKQRISLTAWHESSWPDELDATEKTLESNWDKELIAAKLANAIYELNKNPDLIKLLDSNFEGEYAVKIC